MTEITQELLRSLFDYRDGELYWKKRNGNKAGNLNDKYYRIGINGKNHSTHRLIFLYHHGFLPDFLDHIDGDKQNNKIENLRPASRAQNGMNRESYKNSSSKYKGVYWRKDNNKWQAHIRINNKPKYLGYFTVEEDAAIAYNIAAIKYYGEYARLNEMENK